MQKPWWRLSKTVGALCFASLSVTRGTLRGCHRERKHVQEFDDQLCIAFSVEVRLCRSVCDMSDPHSAVVRPEGSSLHLREGVTSRHRPVAKIWGGWLAGVRFTIQI